MLTHSFCKTTDQQQSNNISQTSIHARSKLVKNNINVYVPRKDLQNNNSDTYFFLSIIKTIYFMTKQVLWTLKKKIFFLQFCTKFAPKQQRLAKIDTSLWLLLLTKISQVWLNTGKIRGRKGQYYQAHIPRSWPLSTTKGGLIQIQTGMHWWRQWMENYF